MSSIGTPVIIQGYPSPCKGPIGNPWCGQNFGENRLDPCWGIVEQDDRPEEFKDLHNILILNLNKTIQEAAQENDWN